MVGVSAPIRVVGEPIINKLSKAYKAASDESWTDTAEHFHKNYRLNRFTHRHATEAGYTPRTKRYTRQKLKKYGHTYPLVKTGEAKKLSGFRRIKTYGGTGKMLEKMVSVSHMTVMTTVQDQGGVKIIYPSLRKLNWRSPTSDVRMAQEFRHVTQREANELGTFFGRKFTPRFQQGFK